MTITDAHVNRSTGTTAGSRQPPATLPGSPDELRAVPRELLGELAEWVRGFLVANVTASGGHLGPNLGTVEPTIALHRVFDSPRDALLFDTGHQAYTHKIFTGRAAGFDRLRQLGGMSGYPSRAESQHDLIENSHASTALSYADGLARALTLRGQHERNVVAVVGDGAMTGEMCWEAMNSIADAGHERMVIVLNDNCRSYAPTVGGLARHLAGLRSRAGLSRTASPDRPEPEAEPSGSRPGANLFESMGLTYLGVVDGHDTAALEAALTEARDHPGPVVVHVATVKGRGYPPAERDEADRLHAVGVVDPATGRPPGPDRPTWTSVFADEIAAIGAERQDVVCLTAAMGGPVGLDPFARAFPDRVFDVGIAEQHAVTCAAGLALGGLHPVVCVYSTFLNRAFDQVLLDVGLHRLPVTFVLDRAGITGPDGASHHGMWDSSLLGLVPGLRIAAPRDPARLRELLREAVAFPGPSAVRYPKATAAEDIAAIARMDGIDLLYRTRSRPLDVLLLAAGATAPICLRAALDLESRGLGVTIADPRWILPVNPALTSWIARHRLTVTVEDATRAGGFGAAVLQVCAESAIDATVRTIALPHSFVGPGERGVLLAREGVSAQGIIELVLDSLPAPATAERPVEQSSVSEAVAP
jgi:1-deoxy-D-xylulose-5-phosphate synthase